MGNRYKIIISNNNVYKEVEISPEMTQLKVGTSVECDVRLHKDLFFEQIELVFFCVDGEWSAICSENLYISIGDLRRLMTKTLAHGDVFDIKYQTSDNQVFTVDFLIDFGFENAKYDKYIDVSNIEKIYIGGTEECQIKLNSPFVETDKIIFEKKDSRFYLVENATKYGIYINGLKKLGRNEIENTDFFAFADFSFYLKDEKLYTTCSSNLSVKGLKETIISNSANHLHYPHFNRSTRLKMVLPDDSIKVLDPVTPPSKPRGNIILQLAPAIIMLGVTILFRVVLSDRSMGSFIWISLISMTMGIVTSVASIVGDKKRYQKETSERERKYQEYIAGKRKEIECSRDKEAVILNQIYYSIDDEIKMVNEFSSELFNRDRKDEDFLAIVLGNGKREAVKKVECKALEKYDSNDNLSELPTKIAEEYKYVDDVPITLDLKVKNAIGVVGKRHKLYGMLKNITVDLATRQYYKDINLFYILEENYQNHFTWLRMLPHVQNDDLGIRNIVCDVDSKNILFEYLYKELTARSTAKKDVYFKNIVVFVYNDQGLKRHPISRFIEQAAQLNVTFIFFEECEEYLPNVCDDVVFLDDKDGGNSILSADAIERRAFTYNEIRNDVAEKLVEKLAPVYCDEVSLEGTLTKNISMYEMLNIMSVEDIDLESNWKNSEVYKSLAAPLGVKAKGQIVDLDLNEKHHGPHGLVAGTTGSGKSEILQSYILSMATLFHPYEVGFVIIDFKGGGMVNQFKDLPHLVGAITNIDGREINRSLLSIKAELRKRQALFAQHNVNHVDAYIKLYKRGEAQIPLPHLILIVDEFAELKMDQPEFMKELISAARIGRSLGIHLILATQKPSGVVDAQIWSNSKFKLCLKVQSKEDSNEVLKTPLAAEIKEPGRAYLQVGNNEIFDLFQSAYSGGPAVADNSARVKKFSINKLDLSGMRTTIYAQKPTGNDKDGETQLSAIVKHVAHFCSQNGIERLPGICLPPLQDVYNYMFTMKEKNQGVEVMVPIGIYDDPNNQRQEKVILNLMESNTFVLGSSQYGKTGLLQTVIRGIADNYSPGEANIYIIDYASMALKVFEKLNHVGGVLLPGEDDKMKLFFKMISKEVKQRKERFSQMGITSFQSYKEAGYKDLPLIVILLDNMIAFRELCDAYDDVFLGLCRDGLSVGVSIMVTAQQMTGIGYKYLSNFGNKYGFTCNDKGEYASLFDRCRMVPKNIPGRALACIDKEIYEFQTFLAFEGEKEIHRVERIKNFIEEKNNQYGDSFARQIPEVPAILTHDYLHKTYGKNKAQSYYIGINFDTVEPLHLEPVKEGYIAISGAEASGRSNYVKYLFQQMQNRIFTEPVEAYVIDNYEQKLNDLKNYGFVEQYTTDASYFEIILDKVENICKERASKCEICGPKALEDEPLLVVVVNNASVYDATRITKDACNQWKNVVKTMKNMKVLFILSGIDNVNPGIGASDILKYLKENKNVLYFDALSTIKLTDVPIAIQRQFKNELAVGDAYYVTTAEVYRVKTPLAKEE